MKYFWGGLNNWQLNTFLFLFFALFLLPITVLAKQQSVPILVYHEVRPIAPTLSETKQRLSITPETFIAQLQYLKKHHYRTILMRDLARLALTNKKISPRTVALTFDDGTRDFYTTVLPLLRQYKIRATLYANPGKDDVEDRMSWAELQAVQASGLVEIGAHTLSHKNLLAASVVEEQEEIVGSKQVLEYLLRAPVVSFAYPYGAYNSEVAEIVRVAGFTSAVIATADSLLTADTIFWWPRHTVGEPEKLTGFIKILHTP